jgi:glycosyltransferase involved in cell wall biosynthesis
MVESGGEIMSYLNLLIILAVSFFVKGLAQYDVTIIGPIDMRDSIGKQSVELVDALRKEFSVNLFPTCLNQIDVPQPILEILNKKSSMLGNVLIFESQFSFARSKIIPFFRKNSHKIRIAYSMYEATEIPEYWVRKINMAFDAVVVPDPFLIEVYKSSGVTVPIFVIPLGLDLKPFLQAPLKEEIQCPFVFANFSIYQPRKNHITLINAFYKAFGQDPSVKLWINGRASEGSLFEELQQQVKLLGAQNITLTKHCFRREEYVDNFNKIDCYVSLSKGEGFSVQPREAMALGIPVIVSDNTAQTTICKSQLVISIPSLTQVPYGNYQEAVGMQYEVNEEDVIEAFKQMKVEYDNVLKNGYLRREWAAQYNYGKLYPLYKTLIKPKEIFLGKEDEITEDYMITTSLELYKKYKKIMTSN